MLLLTLLSIFYSLCVNNSLILNADKSYLFRYGKSCIEHDGFSQCVIKSCLDAFTEPLTQPIDSGSSLLVYFDLDSK